MTNTNVLLSIKHDVMPSDVPLPMEALVLKETLLHTHHHKSLAMHTKSLAFTLLHLRKMVIPPVEIPRHYKWKRTVCVSGVEVPYTRKHFEERRKQTKIRCNRLKTIHE